jgi:hypothetical protein
MSKYSTKYSRDEYFANSFLWRGLDGYFMKIRCPNQARFIVHRIRAHLVVSWWYSGAGIDRLNVDEREEGWRGN